MTKREKRRDRLGATKARAQEFPKSQILAILDEKGFIEVRRRSGSKASHFFFRHPLLLRFFALLKMDPYWIKHIAPGGEIQIVFHGEIAYGSEAEKIDKVLDLLEELENIETKKE